MTIKSLVHCGVSYSWIKEWTRHEIVNLMLFCTRRLDGMEQHQLVDFSGQFNLLFFFLWVVYVHPLILIISAHLVQVYTLAISSGHKLFLYIFFIDNVKIYILIPPSSSCFFLSFSQTWKVLHYNGSCPNYLGLDIWIFFCHFMSCNISS